MKNVFFPKHGDENAVFNQNFKCQPKWSQFQFFKSFIADWKQDYIFNLFSWKCWLELNI